MEVSAEELRKAREAGRTLHSQNRTPHKHAALIKAWADGAQIQRRSPVKGWEDCYLTPSWDNCLEEFRIKPTTIKYRTFLFTLYNKAHIAVCTYEENQREPRCTWHSFITWVGDWQEVEV